MRPSEKPPTISSVAYDGADRSKIARAIEREQHRPVGDPMSAAEARALTDRIRRDAGTLEALIGQAWCGRAWLALGYESWNAYLDTEFASVRLRLPREERRGMVCRLRELGMSIRAIASATGISDQTVQRDLASGVVNHYTSPDDGKVIDAEVITEPKPITGLDDKTYPAKPKPEPRPEWVAARKARDEAEAALTAQERARRDKEAEAFAREVSDQAMAPFSVLIVDNVISSLEELVERHPASSAASHSALSRFGTATSVR